MAEKKRSKKKATLFGKLIRTNTGVSSKSFFLVIVTIISCLLLLVPAITLIIEVCYNHTITTDITAYSYYIASVSTLLASAGITKVWGDKYAKKNNPPSKDEDADNLEN